MHALPRGCILSADRGIGIRLACHAMPCLSDGWSPLTVQGIWASCQSAAVAAAQPDWSELVAMATSRFGSFPGTAAQPPRCGCSTDPRRRACDRSCVPISTDRNGPPLSPSCPVSLRCTVVIVILPSPFICPALPSDRPTTHAGGLSNNAEQNFYAVLGGALPRDHSLPPSP